MNPFDELCNESITIIHKDGRKSGPFKATYGKGRFTVFDAAPEVETGDVIDRTLPNGKQELHDITDVEYTQKFHTIPASAVMTAHKRGALPKDKRDSVVQHISVTHSHGVQIGNHNSQQIVDSFKQLVDLIDRADAPEAEKAEAKGRLRAFLEHPITAAVVGSSVAGLLALL